MRRIAESIVIDQQTLTRQYVYDQEGRLWRYIAMAEQADGAMEKLFIPDCLRPKPEGGLGE